MAAGSSDRVVTSETDVTTQDEVLGHLSRKFDWLEGADTDMPRRLLDDVLSTYEVERIPHAQLRPVGR